MKIAVKKYAAPISRRSSVVSSRYYLTQAAPLFCEISERLHELEDIKLGLGADIVQRLSSIADVSLTAFRFTVRIMHGDSTIFDSFEEQSRERAMTKQAVNNEFRRMLSQIEIHFPELAFQIRDIRQQVNRHEEARSMAINASGEILTLNRGDSFD